MDECILEPWEVFVSRVTHHIERILKDMRLDDWVLQHMKRKFNFAAKLARCEDHRWSHRILAWRPQGTRS
eukprot:6505391-Karenia_brevis.AAC.1